MSLGLLVPVRDKFLPPPVFIAGHGIRLEIVGHDREGMRARRQKALLCSHGMGIEQYPLMTLSERQPVLQRFPGV